VIAAFGLIYLPKKQVESIFWQAKCSSQKHNGEVFVQSVIGRAIRVRQHKLVPHHTMFKTRHTLTNQLAKAMNLIHQMSNDQSTSPCSQ
jgi:hypothetical protein